MQYRQVRVNSDESKMLNKMKYHERVTSYVALANVYPPDEDVKMN